MRQDGRNLLIAAGLRGLGVITAEESGREKAKILA